MTTIRFLLLASVCAARCAGAECVYLAGSTAVRSLVVLDQADFSERFAIDGAGGVLSHGLVVRGPYAYVNYRGFADPDHLLLPGRILQVDLILRTVRGEFATGRGNLDLAYANGKLYTPNALDDSVTVVDLDRGSTQTIAGTGDFPTDVAATPDQSCVAAAALSGSVTLIDTELDRIVHSFRHGHEAVEIAATDDDLFVGTTSGLFVFRREGGSYVESWYASLGFSNGFALAGRRLFSVGRHGLLQAVSLDDPHDTTGYRLGTANLLDVEVHEGLLYVAGEDGLFRFSPAGDTAELLYAGRFRAVAIAPCPRARFTFDGDADCDEALTAADVDATVGAVYGEEAQAHCDADCNRDGRVDAADLGCVVRVLATA
jgi:hypothetical protein